MANMIGKFVSVLIHPWVSMESVHAEGENTSLKSAIMFVIGMGLISGIISSVWGFILPPPPVAAGQVTKWSIFLAIPLVPAISFILSFVGTFVLWGIVSGLLKGTMSEYKTTYRLFALLAAFSPLNALLSPIPTVGAWLGIAINVWGIVVLIGGIIIVMKTPRVRSIVILGATFLVLLALGLVFRNETQRQLAGGPGLPGLGGNDVNDLGDEEALNKELQDMANKAKTEEGTQTAPTPAPAAPTK